MNPSHHPKALSPPPRTPAAPPLRVALALALGLAACDSRVDGNGVEGVLTFDLPAVVAASSPTEFTVQRRTWSAVTGIQVWGGDPTLPPAVPATLVGAHCEPAPCTVTHLRFKGGLVLSVSPPSPGRYRVFATLRDNSGAHLADAFEVEAVAVTAVAVVPDQTWTNPEVRQPDASALLVGDAVDYRAVAVARDVVLDLRRTAATAQVDGAALTVASSDGWLEPSLARLTGAAHGRATVALTVGGVTGRLEVQVLGMEQVRRVEVLPVGASVPLEHLTLSGRQPAGPFWVRMSAEDGIQAIGPFACVQGDGLVARVQAPSYSRFQFEVQGNLPGEGRLALLPGCLAGAAPLDLPVTLAP